MVMYFVFPKSYYNSEHWRWFDSNHQLKKPNNSAKEKEKIKMKVYFCWLWWDENLPREKKEIEAAAEEMEREISFEILIEEAILSPFHYSSSPNPTVS